MVAQDKLNNGENDVGAGTEVENDTLQVPRPQSDLDESRISQFKSRKFKDGVLASGYLEGDSDDESDMEEEEDTLFWKARMKIGSMVNNEKVQIFIIISIMINALMMGIATFDFVTNDEQVDYIFHECDRAFLIIFTIEAAMQLFYLGLSLFSDGWLIFDLAIVILSWSFESLQIVRAFRIFRAFRLITRVKPLRDLVLAIGAVLPRMYAIAALLLLVFYIFSVLFTELFSDLDLDGNDYFGTLHRSLFTCMEMMTLEWGEICRLVMEHYNWAFAPFLSFIAITGFIVFNLIVAVVCDAVAVTEKTVRQMDGYEEDSTEVKIIEAQERIDLLQSHIFDMLKTQEQVQIMIEKMAEELVFLQTERLNAEQREAKLRAVVEERQQYEMQMEEKYFEGKKRREEMRTSTIIGNPLFDAETMLNLDVDSLDASSHIKKRKKQLQKRVSERRSQSQRGDGSVGENSTLASVNHSQHNHDFDL